MSQQQGKKFFRNIRVVEAGKGYLIGAKGYRFYRYNYADSNWKYFGKITDLKYSLASRIRLISRLFRAEVYFYKTLSDGNKIAIARKGLFKYDEESRRFRKCFDIIRGSRPLNFCEDKEGNIYFGEYYHNAERNSVHIYMSEDKGSSWKIAYTFPEKSIRHIHGVYYDKYTSAVWVSTGDLNGECIIGYTTDKFATFNTVFRGGQEYRVCNLLFFEDKIVYATDSETDHNYIRRFDRKTLEFENVASIQSSVISSVKVGDKCFFSTTVEPSSVNMDQKAYIWMYDDKTGKARMIDSFQKDKFNHIYFQFGMCQFAEYADQEHQWLYYSGVAVKKIDGSSVGVEISSLVQ